MRIFASIDFVIRVQLYLQKFIHIKYLVSLCYVVV